MEQHEGSCWSDIAGSGLRVVAAALRGDAEVDASAPAAAPVASPFLDPLAPLPRALEPPPRGAARSDVDVSSGLDDAQGGAGVSLGCTYDGDHVHVHVGVRACRPP